MRRRKALSVMPKRIQSKFDDAVNLKSISVIEDAKQPENLSHYRPTHSGIALIKDLALFETSSCYMLQAAYGTGKSLHAAIAVHSVENTSPETKELLERTAKRISEIDENFGSQLHKRKRSKKKGLSIIMEGYVDDIGTAIFEAIASSYDRVGMGRAAGGVKRRKDTSFEAALELLTEIEQDFNRLKIDRVLFVWDEFGRHLESLVEKGDSRQLHDIQRLAEFCVRRKKCPFTLVLVMHQSFESYNTSSTSTSRAEWKKIDGRFSKIKAGQDGIEFYQLMQKLGKIGDQSQKPDRGLKTYISKLKKAGVFAGENLSDLCDLFSKTPNVEPLVYYLVPKISARLSQNERTVFDFMGGIQQHEKVGIDEVYSYFESTMQADTAVGGTNKLYQQTKMAILKAKDEQEVSAIKACSLLSIDVQGKVKVTKEILTAILANSSTAKEATNIVARLVKRNLFIHRKFNNEVLIWHGSDMDIRKDIKTWRETILPGFNLLTFLRTRFPLKVWRPGRHNDEGGFQRYFWSQYFELNDVALVDFESDQFSEDVKGDGKVLHLICEENEITPGLSLQLKTYTSKHPEYCVVLPKSIPQIRDLALEIEAMEHLIREFHNKNIDPASLEELRSYLDDSINKIYDYIQRLYNPGFGQTYFLNGKIEEVNSSREFREELSRLCDVLYVKAPEILNNVINRHRPTGVMINARKKLLARVLENTDEIDFGFRNPETIYEFSTAVASLFRTTLKNPGFYISEEGRFSTPQEMLKNQQQGYHVWEYVKKFFTEPSPKPKSVSDFVNDLCSSPFGARKGVLPILFAAGLRAFSLNGVLMRSGLYVEDVKPSDVEDALRQPEKYEFQVVSLKKWEKRLLVDMNRCFQVNQEDLVEKDELRRFAEAAALWSEQLPRFSRVTSNISSSAQKIRTVLFTLKNPADCISTRIPAAYDQILSTKKATDKTLELMMKDKKEIDTFYFRQVQILKRWIIDELKIETQDGKERESIQNWAQDYLSLNEDFYQAHLRSFLKALSGATRGSDRDFIRGVTAVTTESLDIWDDRSVTKFKYEFRSRLQQIFESAFESLSSGNECPDNLKVVLAINLKSRLKETILALQKIQSGNQIEAEIESALKSVNMMLEVM